MPPRCHDHLHNESAEAQLRYYHETGEWKNDCILHDTASTGRLADFQFAISHGCQVIDNGSRYLNAALMEGYMDCVVYFHEVLHFPFNEYSTYSAAINDDIQFLRYAVERGAPIFYETLTEAARFNNLDHINYLMDLGDFVSPQAIIEAFKEYPNGLQNLGIHKPVRLDFVELFIQRGYILTDSDLRTIEKHIHIIPFDQPFWRDWLCELDLTDTWPGPGYYILQEKQKDLRTILHLEQQVQQSSRLLLELVLEDRLPQDLIVYSIASYL